MIASLVTVIECMRCERWLPDYAAMVRAGQAVGTDDGSGRRGRRGFGGIPGGSSMVAGRLVDRSVVVWSDWDRSRA